MKLCKYVIPAMAALAISSAAHAQSTTGAIEQLPIRTLSHVLGHDGSGRVGREPVTDFLKPGSTSPITGNIACWGTTAYLITDCGTLGSMAFQNSGSVSITGGSITGITDLAVSDGGTGASTASGARVNLGLGTAATQNTGTSGHNLPFLDGANTWGASQSFSGITVGGVTPVFPTSGLLVGTTDPQTLINKSINDSQTNYTRTGTGAVSLTGATRWQNYPITPQDFNASAGSGGDDSAALNAAAAAASSSTGPNAGVLYLPPPSSGFYNVCADSFRPQKVANGAASLTVRGPAGGGATIRALPGCSSGAVLYATMYIEGEAFGENVKSQTKLTFENVRIDGYCLSRYSVYNVYTVGLTFRNSVLRNAATGNGANYYQQSGYETSMDNSNRLENVNDAGHTCYNTSADLPNYNMWITGTDNQFGAVAINAKIANYYAAGGGNNHFTGTHGWGYPGGTDGQPNLRPQYNYLMEGNQVLTSTIGDQPTLAGIRLQNTIGDNSGAIVTGHTVTGPVESGVKGISLGTGVNHSTITNNNLTYVTAANGLVSDSTIDPSNIIYGNNTSVPLPQAQAWNTYTPTITCGTGSTPTTSGVGGRYQVVGKTISFYATATITTNGTCGQSFNFSLPFASLATTSIPGYAYNSSGGAKQAFGIVTYGSSTLLVTKYDASYPGTDGSVIQISGSYEAQ